MFWAVTTRHSKDNSQKKRRFCAFSFLYQKEGPACGIPQAGPYHCEQNCKPGSVFDSHLSRRIVAGTLKPPREQPGQPLCSHTGVAPDRVYSDGQFPAVGCALTAPFHPYWQTPASASHLPAVYLCCTFPEVAFGGRYPVYCTGRRKSCQHSFRRISKDRTILSFAVIDQSRFRGMIIFCAKIFSKNFKNMQEILLILRA